MIQRRNIFWHLCITTIVFVSIVTTYYVHRYQQLQSDTVLSTAKHALNQLAYSEREYRSARTQLVSVVDLLAHSSTLKDYFVSPTPTNRNDLIDVWSSVALNHQWYRQIQLLDQRGTERLRLDYFSSEARISIDGERRDQSHLDYFNYAKTLKNKQIGAWGIDLKTAEGNVIYPYQPSLRLIAPIDIENQRVGYLVMNIDVWHLISRLNDSPDDGIRPQLVEGQGYVLAQDDRSLPLENPMGFSPQNMAKRYPNSWQQIQKKKSGYVLENQQLVVFNQLPLSEGKTLYQVVKFSQDDLEARCELEYRLLIKEASIIFLVVITLIMPVTSTIIYYRNRSLESQLARAALNGMTAVVISDKHHRAILVNREFETLTGYRQEEMADKHMLDILLSHETESDPLPSLASKKKWEGEIKILHQQTGIIATAIIRIQSVAGRGSRSSYYITSLIDISQRKELEERLRILSEKDELTQLWNRRKFEVELRSSTKLMERYRDARKACLALLDIDFFKRVNDEMGHDEGDRVISRVGAILTEALRETDFIARIGGEEFAIIMPHTNIEEAELALERVRIAVEMAPDVPVTISAGLTDLTGNSTRCYKCADIALYESKTLGRNQISLCYSHSEFA
ncbi:diguanylate cyclase [Vibrio ostreicida]|uniref:diguanylate cyclase n=1 Tax=Vibrio ostreicida TaxID=526588 RepID=A0ABT8BRZ0_9VIBR|nr:diguanylate cyclase [Vibrio ostreicida]MDN3608990.1 diguanylate cyclase [Vibrio ostreicida]